jgi:hypothetical protein
MTDQRPPSVAATSFNCPHCGSLAHQTWYSFYTKIMSKDEKPFLWGEDVLSRIEKDLDLEPDVRKQWIAHAKKMQIGDPFIDRQEQGAYLNETMENVWASQCYSCGRFGLWVHGNLIYPAVRTGDEPNEDLSDEIRRDYEEARSVLNLSPRAAAALLRLCIQKICRDLKADGKDINEDIAKLVADGLDIRVQQALDVVRVIGNNAIHPGQIDLRDDRETATQLFRLVNIIAEKMISEPKHIQSIFDSLPASARDQIAKRGKAR